MDQSLIQKEIEEVSSAWVQAFNRGDIKHCAGTYTLDAVMEVINVGRFVGRQSIYEYWQYFLNSTHATGLNYRTVEIQIVDQETAFFSASWLMSIGHGQIIKACWIKTEAGWQIDEERLIVEEQYN